MMIESIFDKYLPSWKHKNIRNSYVEDEDKDIVLAACAILAEDEQNL